MNADFFNALDLLEKERGIDKEYMITKIEAALANACRKEVGPTTVIRVQLDPVKQDMRVFWQRTHLPKKVQASTSRPALSSEPLWM